MVENVVPYYAPLVPPTLRAGRHLFWSNFPIPDLVEPEPLGARFAKDQTLADGERLKAWLGIQYTGTIYYADNHCPTQVLRNCVHPEIGLQIMQAAEVAQLMGHPLT